MDRVTAFAAGTVLRVAGGKDGAASARTAMENFFMVIPRWLGVELVAPYYRHATDWRHNGLMSTAELSVSAQKSIWARKPMPSPE